MTAERYSQNSLQHYCAGKDCKQTKQNLDPSEGFHVFPPACVFSGVSACIPPFLFRSVPLASSRLLSVDAWMTARFCFLCAHSSFVLLRRQLQDGLVVRQEPAATYSIAVGTRDRLMDAIPGSIERCGAIFSINSSCLPRVDTLALSRMRSLPGSLSL